MENGRSDGRLHLKNTSVWYSKIIYGFIITKEITCNNNNNNNNK